MLLVDLTHTSHTRARTGVQRVVRSLYTALGARGPTLGVCHDPYLHAWRTLQPWETENLTSDEPAAGRGAQWPLSAQFVGRASRLLKRTSPPLPPAAGVIVPEIFSATVNAALPALFATTGSAGGAAHPGPRGGGPRVALFHDAIALKYPELSPAKTVTRFPAYLRELLAFDGIAAVSDDSRDSLLDYWRWLGLRDTPPVVSIPLASDAPPPPARSFGRVAALPTVLSVGSIEGRKNHLALLEACEQLWARGLAFELHLIGLAHPQTGRAALQKARALQAAGRPLRYDGPVDDDALHDAYRQCAFTVYPSLIEGFGLPVLESLRHGRPCICSARGALGESARGGGCVPLPSVDAGALEAAIERLLAGPSELAALSQAARGRTFRTWPDYAADIQAWMAALPTRSQAC